MLGLRITLQIIVFIILVILVLLCTATGLFDNTTIFGKIRTTIVLIIVIWSGFRVVNDVCDKLDQLRNTGTWEESRLTTEDWYDETNKYTIIY